MGQVYYDIFRLVVVLKSMPSAELGKVLLFVWFVMSDSIIAS